MEVGGAAVGSAKIRVVPIRVTLHSAELSTDVRRVVAWRAVDGDEWEGPSRKTRQDAAQDAAERRAQVLRPAG